MRRNRIAAALLGCALAMSHAPAALAQPADLELRVKAAFLFNFARFVTWAPAKFKGPRDPILLCVLLPDPFGDILEDTVRGKTVDGRAIQVRRAPRAATLRECHIVYAGPRPSDDLDGAMADLQGAGVLIVHEGDHALPGGGMRFLLGEDRVRFEINAAAAARENLRISSKLLSVARVVQL